MSKVKCVRVAEEVLERFSVFEGANRAELQQHLLSAMFVGCGLSIKGSFSLLFSVATVARSMASFSACNVFSARILSLI